jgi:hypothetical protein
MHGALMLQILGAIGEFERKLIRCRVEVGIKKAREDLVPFGRTPKLGAKQKLLTAELHGQGATIRELSAVRCGRRNHPSGVAGGVNASPRQATLPIHNIAPDFAATLPIHIVELHGSLHPRAVRRTRP